MKKIALFALLPFMGFAQKTEIWRLEIDSPGGKIPVHIEVTDDGKAFAINAEEKMAFDRVYTHENELFLDLDLYDLQFTLKPQGNKATGYISKRSSVDNLYRQAPFTGVKGDEIRFKNPKNLKPAALSSKYEVTFTSTSSKEDSPAIGIFDVKDGKVNGSFLTNTGDHRFLQGNVVGDSLFLSAVGTSVYLYKAKIKGDSLVGGEVFHPFEKTSTFKGVKNDKVVLDDASKLTFLKKGYDKFDFTFPNLFNEKISLSDPQFKDKVTVVQILGTWCPNCLDETRFLLDYNKENPDLKIIGLAFERSDEVEQAHPKIARFIHRFNVDYPVLFAGKIDQAGEKLPQLNHVMAFPTSIIIDKKGSVRKIHTGFAGPGTGSYYTDYVKEFKDLITKLQAE